MKRQTGFTLIELLVVVAIIALLVSILVPSLQEARVQAKLAVDMSNQRQIILAALTYENAHGKFPPAMTDIGNGAQDHPNSINYNITHISDYLGMYLPGGGGDVFLSPLGPPKPDYYDSEYEQSSWTLGSGGMYTLTCSYYLLWNFDLHKDQPEPIRFVGASSTVDADVDSLLTQTVVTWWVNGHATTSLWRDPTPWNDYARGFAGCYFTIGPPDLPPTDLPVNAGFMDGSVQRFSSGDLRFRPWPDGYGYLLGFYLYDPDL